MSANTVQPPKPFTRSSGGEQSVFTALKHIKHLLVLALVSLLLVGCGGSGGGFQDADNVLTVQISPVDGGYEMPWNPTLAPFDTRQPFTKTIRVEVRDHRNQLFPAEAITVDIAPSGEHGNLFTPIPPGDDLEDAGPFSRAVLDDTSGLAELFFVSNNKPGTVTLTASVQDPASGRLVSATMRLTVVGDTQPVTSLTFTGPFVNAVREGFMATAIAPGEAILQDGSYQRVVSVVAADENGNPPLIGTPIDFYLVDGPLEGYPAQGPGRFAIAGPDGDPEEGTINFRVDPNPGGGFLGPVMNGPAVRPLNDRLVLDGRQEQNPGGSPSPNNRTFTGLWRVETVANNNWLTIEQDPAVANSRRFPPFPLNPAAADTGATVPYIIGSARHATILRTANTNDTGVASTLLTYPVSRLGQTAVLLACTREQALSTDGSGNFDRRVCGILNTCDRNGDNCGSVFLPVSDGTDTVLTVNPTEIGPNTTTPVTACLRDPNFTPIPAATIDYDISSFLGSATVDLDGNPALSGSLQTGANGCVTTQVRSSGQAPGSEPIVINFTANGVAEAVPLQILGPGAGQLIASLENCQGIGSGFSPAPIDDGLSCRCTVGLLLIDDRGGRIPGAMINTILADGIEQVRFGNSATGMTNDRGEATATVTYSGASQIEFESFGTTVSVPLPSCGAAQPPEISLQAGADNLAPGESTTFTVVLDKPAPANLTIGIGASGATGVFTFPDSVTVNAGRSSATFVVQANANAPSGAQLSLQLLAGIGYTGSGSATITASDADAGVPGQSFTFTGTGENVVERFTVDRSGAVFFDLTHQGSSSFWVRLLDEDAQFIRSLVQVFQPESENFSGQTVQNLSAGNYLLEIRRGDEWTIEVTTSAVPGEPGDPDVPVNSVVLVTSSPQLPSAGLEPVTLTAFVRDANNVLMQGVDVTFAADNDGTLQVTRRTTDETGSAQALLSTEGNKTNRDIQVTARVGAVSNQVVVRVTGTNILIAGRRSALLGEQIRLDLTLRDSENVGIPNVPLTVDFTTGAGNVLDANNLTTNNRGQASVLLGMTTAGENVVRVSGAGAQATHPIDVSADQFEFVVPEPPGEDEPAPTVNLGDNQPLTVRWQVAGVPQPGQNINFTATRGVLSATSATTNADGEATVTIAANNAGPSVITATTPDGISTQLEILFVATIANSMTLQTKPAVIGTNIAGETDQQSEIIAVIRDPAGNLVKGKTINFTLTDITGGTLSPASAVTDVFGRASTTYTAGTTPSAQDGVSIRAVVADTPTVEQTVTLTVARRDLFITLGTGNTIEKPDAVRYNLPYGVLVTDAAGNPVANAQVTIEAWPRGYHKGFWTKPGPLLPWEQVETLTLAGSTLFEIVNVPIRDADGNLILDDDGKPISELIRVDVRGCLNEDLNRDGILNPGEDWNNNNQLDPGNVVTVSQTNLVTDETGFADFNVVYFQQFAQWIDLELTARATVAGSEATEQVFFRLPILAADVAPGSPTPPGNPSPFGVSDTCADDL